MKWTEFPILKFHYMNVYQHLLTQKDVKSVYISLDKEAKMIAVSALTSIGRIRLADRHLSSEVCESEIFYPEIFSQIAYTVGEAVEAFKRCCESADPPPDPVKEEMHEALDAAFCFMRGARCNSDTYRKVRNALKSKLRERRG